MVYAYIRFSTDKQDQTQQKFALDEYAKQRGLTIDEFEIDEGISGGVSYKERKLYKLVRKMKPGDILITTEISRLGRSMGDLNMFVTQELKPRKLRLIVIKMGLDLDCSNLKAVDEMIIFAFGFSAQCEKDMICQRTQAALDARKELIQKQGGFVSKSGHWCKKLGAKKGHDYGPVAGAAAALALHKKSQDWREGSILYSWVEKQLLRRKSRAWILDEARRLYEEEPEKYCTRQGKCLTKGTLSVWAREIKLS